MEFKHTNNHFETSVSVYLHAPSKIKAIYADKVFAENQLPTVFHFCGKTRQKMFLLQSLKSSMIGFYHH